MGTAEGGMEGVRDDPIRDSAHSKGLGTNKRTPRARSRKRKDAGHANSYLMESPRSMPGELVLACSGKTSFDESEFKFS